MRTAIIDAIHEKRCLTVYYDPGERIIEPHAYGRGADGQILLRAYQRSGASESGERSDWKLFRCDEIRLVADAGAPFGGPRPGYKRGDRQMKGGIIAQL